MRTGIIKDPTFTKYSNGGNVERKGKETTKEDLKQLSEDPMLDQDLELMSIIKELYDTAVKMDLKGRYQISQSQYLWRHLRGPN